MRTFIVAIGLSVTLLATTASAEPGHRLPATGGVSSVEGAGGGGLTPWALISGYASPDESDVLVFASVAQTQDYQLRSAGLALGWADRVELSYAHSDFDVDIASAAIDETLSTDTLGLKLKLFGDVIFAPQDSSPQISVGVQAKRSGNYDFVEAATAAEHRQDSDLYIAASKLYFGVVFGRNLLLNVGARHTRANQFGLLGFGGPREKDYCWCVEASAALLLNDYLALGAEYRQKPDNLSLREDDAKDLFLAWFPSKRLSLTLAYLDLCGIVVPYTRVKQTGAYLSAQVVF